MQTKKRSFKEAVSNTVIGYFITLICSPLLYWMCGIEYRASQLCVVTLLFTVLSVLRGYFVRRFFNKGDRTGKFVNEYPDFESVLNEQRRICADEMFSRLTDGTTVTKDDLYSIVRNSRMPT